MRCFVYRSPRKADTYLYLPRADDFETVPADLLEAFGEPRFALEFELTCERRLAMADADEIMQRLHTDGYYLQMPHANDQPG